MDAAMPISRRRRVAGPAVSPVTVVAAVTADDIEPRLVAIEQDHEALRDALFGPDQYHPAGILGDLNRSMTTMQSTLDKLPETMTATIKAERASRGMRKLAAWQKAGVGFGIVTGVILAGGTVYEVLVGLSHSLLH